MEHLIARMRQVDCSVRCLAVLTGQILLKEGEEVPIISSNKQKKLNRLKSNICRSLKNWFLTSLNFQILLKKQLQKQIEIMLQRH